MDRRDELEQQLWEFVYDLLPEDEAGPLRGRIAAEADVARLEAEIRGQAAVLARAAKLELPPIPLAPSVTKARESGGRSRWHFRRSARRRAPGADARPSASPWANGMVALVALLLLGYLGVAGFRSRSLEGALAQGRAGTARSEQPLRTIVIGPSELQVAATNHFAVRTQTASGVPRSVAVQYRVTGDDGTLLTSGQVQSDASGFAQFHLPPSSTLKAVESPPYQNVHLELQTQTTRTTVAVPHAIARSGFRLTTSLSTDKTVYRPGEIVRGRSVTLDRASLQTGRDVPVQFLILDAAGQETQGTRREVRSRHGVAFAEFVLPRFQPGGTYTLVARSPTDAFAEVRREFHVRPYRTPHGDQRPAAIRASDSRADVFSAEDISVHEIAAKRSVEFFPESGELVEGVTNRVYFLARDARGGPVSIQGRVVDGQDRELAAVRTIHDGRGVFEFEPVRGETYRLELDDPSSQGERFELPPLSGRQFVVLDAGSGVFAAGAPLQIRLRTSEQRPLAVKAVCRGAVVGQELVSSAVFQQASQPAGPEVSVPLADAAEGVIRLTVYDYSVLPPAPVAERLVFRRPQRKLSIQPSQHDRRHRGGEVVEWSFSVQDERGRPLQAVLGASVVDEAAWNQAQDRSDWLTTHFWLSGQIDDVRGLDDANVYLAEGSKAEQALDLLLGTQGARRYVLPADPRTLARSATDVELSDVSEAELAAAVAVAEPAGPVLLADNAAEAEEAVRSELADLHSSHTRSVRRVGLVLVAGSLMLTVILGLLALARRMPAPMVWLPATGTAVVCLMFGVVWLAADGTAPWTDGEEFYARNAAERQIAKAESAPDAGPMEASPPAAASDRDSLAAKPSDRWHPAADQEARDRGLSRDKLPASEAVLAERDAAAPADKSVPPTPRQFFERQEEGAGERFSSRERPEREQDDRLPLRQRKMRERAELIEEKQQRDAPAESPGAPQAAPAEPARVRRHEAAAAAGRASGATALGESLRRGKPEGLGAPAAEPAPAAGLGMMEEAAPAPAAPPSMQGYGGGGMGGMGGMRAKFDGGAAAPQSMLREYAAPRPDEIADARTMSEDTLYWEPLLFTDAQGRVTIRIRLPDAAATYRVLIDGHAQGRIGSHRDRITVDPELPGAVR